MTLRDYIRSNVLGMVAIFIALSGTAWAANTISSSDIIDGEVKNPDLAADAVTSAKIKNANVASADVGANAINSAKVAADSLAAADIGGGAVGLSELNSNAFDPTDLAPGPVNVFPQAGYGIKPKAIQSSEVEDRTLTGADLAFWTLNYSNIADDAIRSPAVQDDTLTGADIDEATLRVRQHAGGPPHPSYCNSDSELGHLAWSNLANSDNTNSSRLWLCGYDHNEVGWLQLDLVD